MTTEVVSPTAGLVVQVSVTEGQTVSAGETVVTLQSMKTEIAITADAAGKVGRVLVKKGDEVSVGQTLVEIES